MIEVTEQYYTDNNVKARLLSLIVSEMQQLAAAGILAKRPPTATICNTECLLY